MEKRLFSVCLVISLILSACQPSKNSTRQPLQDQSQNVDIEPFTVAYTRKGVNAYQSYDYQSPDTLIRKYEVSFSLSPQQFHSQIRSYFPGGFVFEQYEIQPDTSSSAIAWDGNGIILGKRYVNTGKKRFQEVNKQLKSILTFLQLADLNDNDIISSTEQHVMAETYIDSDTTIYTFEKGTMKLLTVENSLKNEEWVYQEYKEPYPHSYASKVTYKINGKERFTYQIESVSPLIEIPRNKMELPKGYGPELKNNDEVEIKKLSTRLYLINNVAGDRNVLFLNTGKSVIVFGAPINDKWSKKAMEVIQAELPDTPITHVYVTHPHSDHIGGLAAYASSGTTILSDHYSIEAIKHYPRFQSVISDFKFQSINDITLEDVTFYEVNNDHSKGQSFAYFEKEDVIYLGDFLEIPQDNTIPEHISNTAWQFIDFVIAKEIPVSRMVGHHRNDSITMDIIDQLLKQR